MVLPLTSNCSRLLVVVPIVLGIVTQIGNTLQFLLSIHQPLSQPNILAIVLPLMLLRSGMTSLKMLAVQHQLPPSERSLKYTCLQKPTQIFSRRPPTHPDTMSENKKLTKVCGSKLHATENLFIFLLYTYILVLIFN